MRRDQRDRESERESGERRLEVEDRNEGGTERVRERESGERRLEGGGQK